MRYPPFYPGVLLLALVSMGCGEEESPLVTSAQCEQTIIEEGLECEGTLFQEELSSRTHIEESVEILYECAPPTQGPHYGRWAIWGESSSPIPRGHWVHNLEHGGVGLLYRCDSGCAEWVEELRTVMDSVPTDLSCSAAVGKRVFLSEDPLLPFSPMVAAVAWQNGYTATCVDSEEIGAFIEDHYGNGPESVCAEGTFLGIDEAEPERDRLDPMALPDLP